MSGAGSIKDDASNDAYLFEIKDAQRVHQIDGRVLFALFKRGVRQGREALYVIQFNDPDIVVECRVVPGGRR